MATPLGPNELGSRRSPGPRNGGTDFFSNLAPELIDMIFEELRPSGSITEPYSDEEFGEIRHPYLTARSVLSSLCVVSKRIHPFANRHLCRTVVIQSQKELLVFFCTLANIPELRLTVRSFA